MVSGEILTVVDTNEPEIYLNRSNQKIGKETKIMVRFGFLVNTGNKKLKWPKFFLEKRFE